MEIEYSLKPEDFQALSRYHRKLRSVKTQLALSDVIGVLIIVILTIGLGLAAPAFLLSGEGVLGSWMGITAGFFGTQILFRWWQERMNRSSLKAHCEDPRTQWAVRDVRVVLSPDQLLTVSHGSTSTYEWSRIWHIGVTDKHIFLYITRNTAIVIPQRVFRDADQFEEFLALVRQYQQGREQQAPKPTGIIAGLPPQSDAFTRPDAP